MSHYRILIAEDEPSIREILCELLQSEGFDCSTAVDGQEAFLKLQKEKYDLLISDFRMPRMTGDELLKACRKEHIHLPVIFITANQELFPDEKLALADCCSALLNKPIDIDTLLTAIEAAKARNHERECPFEGKVH